MIVKASLKVDKEFGFLFNGITNELANMVNDYKL